MLKKIENPGSAPETPAPECMGIARETTNFNECNCLYLATTVEILVHVLVQKCCQYRCSQEVIRFRCHVHLAMEVLELELEVYIRHL